MINKKGRPKKLGPLKGRITVTLDADLIRALSSLENRSAYVERMILHGIKMSGGIISDGKIISKSQLKIFGK